MAKARKKNKPPRRPIRGTFIFALGLLMGGGGMWWYKAEPQEREEAVTTASNYWEVASTKTGEWIDDIRERLDSTDAPVEASSSGSEILASLIHGPDRMTVTMRMPESRRRHPFPTR